MLSERWVRNAGMLGTLLLFAALLTYFFDQAISTRVFALLVAGVVGLGIWITFAPEDVRGWLSGKQAAAGTTSFIVTAAFAAFVVVVYGEVDRQNITVDFTSGEQFTLNLPSLETIQRLKVSGQRVRLVGFYPRSTLREQEAADIILRQYDLQGGESIEVQFVNPDAEPLIARQYAYTEYVALSESGQRDALFVSLITADGQVDRNTVRPISPINERTISTEILQLITVSNTKFYFTTGHTEFDIESQAGTGLARAAVGGLGALNMQTAKVNLLTEDIPEDASVLVIAGNSQAFVQSEVDKIAAYIAGGGRLVIMANPPYIDATFGGVSVPLLPDSPLGQYIWNEFGVRPQADLVVDEGSSFDTVYNPVIAAMDLTHPVLKDLSADTAVVFSLATSFEIATTPEGNQNNYVLQPLLASSSNSYGETSLEVLQSGTLTDFDADSDLSGPLVMGIAIQTINEVNDEAGARVVILGDVDWLTNDFVVNFPGNSALWGGIAQWVTGTPTLVTQDAFINNNKFPMSVTAQERQRISIITTLVLPGLVLLVGALVWYSRRRH